nr:MAG TPA: hypothetical protein [Caudoviricetes sp.]
MLALFLRYIGEVLFQVSDAKFTKKWLNSEIEAVFRHSYERFFYVT